MYIYVYTYVYVSIYACMYMYICMCVCIYTYMCVLSDAPSYASRSHFFGAEVSCWNDTVSRCRDHMLRDFVATGCCGSQYDDYK